MDTSSSNSVVGIENTEIIIVGAGIAGLGAAITLEQSNFKNYILLEAQSQIGGRICSIPWNNSWLEKGAQFLHGKGSKLAQLIEERGFLSDIEAVEGDGLYLREDGSEIDKKLIAEVDEIVSKILIDCEKYSINNDIDFMDVKENIGKVLRTKFYKHIKLTDDPLDIKNAKEELFDWNVRFLAIDNACILLDELSLKSWGKYKCLIGPKVNVFKSYYGSIVESIAKQLTKGNLRLDSPVKKIEWSKKLNLINSKSVLVTLQNNKKILANSIIVTCSLGFLKENHDKLFTPILPTRLTKAIESLGFGVINKIFLEFSETWWDPNIKGFQFLWKVTKKSSNDELIKNKLSSWTRDITGFDVLKDHQTVLLGWVGGKGACIIETLSQQQIIQDCAELFRFFLKNNNVPKANKCLWSCWASNQFIRGSYSHITKKCDITGVSPATLAEPIWRKVQYNEKQKCLPILMLAGEATHDNFYSTTHGAYDSGIKQAQTFLSYITQ
ncbi:PREDICTED: spermine oxidase-like [Ceratosolen solmsi marchali]|uniref:Spermine oxidase-like n=1 Tax=Ceratosolen solmsi marchali TaxID=326594 RepID=A0AAJ7DUQ0_9HYME|nr:PREDICTED: spermine oxidase-like [Ceratosolen solmsi marchali]